MYFIRKTKVFEKSFLRIKKSGVKKSVLKDIETVIDKLSKGDDLPEIYHSHNLHGELSSYRECHIQSNLLLIYRYENKNLILLLVDIGSHSDLFG